MRQVVDKSRRPEPIRLSAEEGFEKSILEAEKKLKDKGCEGEFIYQVGVSLPPFDEYNGVKTHLRDNRKAVYVLAMGAKDDKRVTERATLDYDFELGDFDIYGSKIDELIENNDYGSQFWKVGGVEDYSDRKDVLETLEEGFPLQATNRIEAGMEEPVRTGWFYKAPLNKEIEFGYRCFYQREQQYTDQGSEEWRDEILSELYGHDQEVLNEHYLSHEELETLQDLEGEMRRLNIL